MPTLRRSARLLRSLSLAAGLVVLPDGCTDPGVVAPARAALPASRPSSLPDYARLRAALEAVRGEANGGFGLDMWATVVDRRGAVVAVVFTGDRAGDEWPGGRVVSAQKAGAANAFSLPDLALSTANLYTAVQPGGSLFGLHESNPLDPAALYGGRTSDYGTPRDFMVGRRVGGINVFGGGLPLYDARGELVGAIGVSGDAVCADHVIAWKVRDRLGLDYVPAGVSPGVGTATTDNIVYDIVAGVSGSGWGHPACSAAATTIGNALPSTNPVSSR